MSGREVKCEEGTGAWAAQQTGVKQEADKGASGEASAQAKSGDEDVEMKDAEGSEESAKGPAESMSLAEVGKTAFLQESAGGRIVTIRFALQEDEVSKSEALPNKEEHAALGTGPATRVGKRSSSRNGVGESPSSSATRSQKRQRTEGAAEGEFRDLVNIFLLVSLWAEWQISTHGFAVALVSISVLSFLLCKCRED